MYIPCISKMFPPILKKKKKKNLSASKQRWLSKRWEMGHRMSCFSRMSSGVIEGCVRGRVDSCQGKIKRVSAGVGERGASDGGPRCSNPTGWITWPLYNCVRGALPTALSLLNRPGLARPSEGAAWLLPSLLLFSRSALLSSSVPLFFPVLGLVRSCEPTVWGGNHYLSSIPQLSSGGSLLLWWPTSSFLRILVFSLSFFPSFCHNGVHFAAVHIM